MTFTSSRRYMALYDAVLCHCVAITLYCIATTAALLRRLHRYDVLRRCTTLLRYYDVLHRYDVAVLHHDITTFYDVTASLRGLHRYEGCIAARTVLLCCIAAALYDIVTTFYNATMTLRRCIALLRRRCDEL